MKTRSNKSRFLVGILIVFMGLLALWLNLRPGLRHTPAGNPPYRHETGLNRNRGFDRTISYLEYTRHAKCRMQCRHITNAEVEDIMRNGSVNYRKSDLNQAPCPTYALEGYTRQDNQHVRIVFAQCDTKTKVVTCIDLDNEFECDCK